MVISRPSKEKKRATGCPFIGAALDCCYCTNMKSGSIEDAIHYCGGNFSECYIFKEMKSGGREMQFLTHSEQRENA